MSSIKEEFGDDKIKEIVRKVKVVEKVGVLRILPFIRNNTHFYSQFDEVLSLHAFKDAANEAERIGWIKKEVKDRKHYYSLTKTGEKITDLFLEMLSTIQ